MASVRAALGLALPQTLLPTAQLGPQQSQHAQQAQTGQIRQDGAGAAPRQGQAIDPDKLFSVPDDVKKLAASSTDAQALLIKVLLAAHMHGGIKKTTPKLVTMFLQDSG